MAETNLKIPTILLTGFLGAGKTTLLNRLIDHYRSRRTVLLINEFGQVSIDGELVKAGNYHKIELNKGSLFCICVRTDFIAEVEKIARDIQPEFLIIEATGLADTTEMEKMLALPNLKDYIHLIINLCVVDCENFLKIKDMLNAPISQIRSADVILINKIDLVDTSQVQETVDAVRQFTANVRFIKTQYADFPMEILDEIARPQVVTNDDPGEGRPDPVLSMTLEKSGRFSQKSWQEFRKSLPNDVMRAKGFVRIGEQFFLVEATMNRWTMQSVIKKDNYPNRLVIIGARLDHNQIEMQFEKCIEP